MMEIISRATAIVAKTVMSAERLGTSDKIVIFHGEKLRRNASNHTRAMLMPMLKPILSMLSSLFVG